LKILYGHGGYLFEPDVEPLKYEYRIGLETLIVRTVNQWALHIGKLMTSVSVNAKVPRLGSKAAKAKLKEIGGSLYERWSVWFNSIIRAKSYQCIENVIK